MRRNRTEGFSLITLILLIALIIFFYMELFIVGLRIYAGITNSPEAENQLGNYYRLAAKQNNSYSESFYKRALEQYTIENQNADSPEKKATINLGMGRNYECGRGTAVDLKKAKSFYDEAKNSNPKDEELNKKIDEAQARINEKMKAPNPANNCLNEPDIGFFSSFGFLQKLKQPSENGHNKSANEHPKNEPSKK